MAVLTLLPLWLLASCKEASEEKLVIDETRPLTIWDEPRLPIIAMMPPEWRQVAGNDMRILNYRFGKDGEVYVSNTKGGVLPNVNRWLKQFDKPPVEHLDELAEVMVLGQSGVLVEAVGKFGGGMGKLPREGAALLGVVLDFGSGVLTIKMIGSKEAVQAERKRLITYCQNLRYSNAD